MSEETLFVSMNGQRVGVLEKKSDGGLSFAYEKAWLTFEGTRPISLTLPLTNRAYTGNVVFNYFDNLLPENAKLRDRIQSRFRIPSKHPFDMLSCIGKDCVGSLQFQQQGAVNFSKKIQKKLLSEKELSTLIDKLSTAPLGMDPAESDFRISLAGVQEKTALLKIKNKWYLPLGDTPSTHIIKPPIGITTSPSMDLSDSCENEWLCSKIIGAFGFEVAHCEIEKFGIHKALVVERFDRKLSEQGDWIMRLPQEDVCQSLGYPAHIKYQSDGGPGIEEIMHLLEGSANATEDRKKFFEAQILFWLLCAIDGHAKNFSLFIQTGGRYTLTPLYDIMSAFPMMAEKQLSKQKVKMAMSLKGKNTHYKWFTMHRSHFINTAERVGFNVSEAEEMLDSILSRVEQVIVTVKIALPKDFPMYLANAIFDGMRRSRQKLEKHR